MPDPFTRPDPAAAALLCELDRIARDAGPGEYGLPFYAEEVVPLLMAAVGRYRLLTITAALTEAR